MFKNFFIALIVLFTAFNTLEAGAVVLNNDKLKADISKEIAKVYIGITDAKVESVILTLPFASLEVPDGRISLTVSSKEKFQPRDVFKVSVYSNSKLVRNFNVPVQNKAYKYVYVASSVIQRDKAINKTNVKLERKEIANLINYVVDEKNMNKEVYSKKIYKVGEMLDNRFLKAKPEILRNSEVTVFFNTNNLTVTVEATALSDGNIGDSICAMNKRYNRLYRGTVIGENRILVQI